MKPMTITLSKPLASNSPAEAFDVKQVKGALNKLGYYKPLETVGMNGTPDRAMFEGLRVFQRDQGLLVSGVLRPDDESVRALNKAASQTPPGYYVWRTVGDEKVRNSHAAFDYQIRAWDDAPDPGEEFNCRCWAENLTLEQEEEVKTQRCFDMLPWRRRAKQNIEDHERNVPHPYIDTAFKITVGVGSNIDAKGKFMSLPWLIRDNGNTATKDEIENAYAALTAQKSNQENIKTTTEDGQEKQIFNVLARSQAAWTNLWLSDQQRAALFEETFEDFYQAISTKKFAGFDCFPPPAKVALMDMIFNLGETRFSAGKWPNLFKAVQQRQWEIAALESSRRIPNDSGGRNQTTFDQFMEAAEIEKQSKG
jgi:GH24 family phage-related lysozyme (muramidase)